MTGLGRHGAETGQKNSNLNHKHGLAVEAFPERKGTALFYMRWLAKRGVGVFTQGVRVPTSDSPLHPWKDVSAGRRAPGWILCSAGGHPGGSGQTPPAFHLRCPSPEHAALEPMWKLHSCGDLAAVYLTRSLSTSGYTQTTANGWQHRWTFWTVAVFFPFVVRTRG